MPYASLRDFIDRLESSERLTRVAVPALGRETVVTVPTEHLAIV